jgi:uncharacterized protein (TIGR02246 family)
MKRNLSALIAFAALGVLVLPALGADSDAAKAEQEIRARAQEFMAAWQKHDAALIAAFYTEDGDIVTGNGRVFSGREGIEQTLRDAFDDSLKDSTFSSTVEKVKLVKPDVAIVDYDAQLKGGNADEPRKFHMVSVLVKQGNKWLTQTSRSIVYAEQ